MRGLGRSWLPFLNELSNELSIQPFLFLLWLGSNSIEALYASQPRKELPDPELRRCHGSVVVGILLAGSTAFGLVLWVPIWALLQ
jgi:hypothetical protein